jgi:hypothetical protein
MHLIETYALSSGSKIGKPYIYEKFFPLSVDKYITIHPVSKYDSKSYSYWQEVIGLLKPSLSKRNINIIQIGTKEDRKLKGCINLNGLTNINQIAYILSKAELHLGVDSFPTHVASSYNKKIVCLYSNNYINVVRPYWGNSSNHVLLQELAGKKPSFSASESPKSIDNIKPEDIAGSVFSLLGIEDGAKYKTAIRGTSYFHRRVESVPDGVINNLADIGLDTIIMRMDLLFNEEILAQQLSVSNCCIITKLPINIDLLKHFAPKIKQFIYILDENHNPAFVQELQNLGISYHLQSEMTEDELNSIKLYYLDSGIIERKLKIDPKLVNSIKSEGLDKLFYRSNKFLISKGSIYQSISAYEKGIPCHNFDPEFSPVIDSDSFWNELDFFFIMKKLD